MTARLRDRRLSPRPRIVISPRGNFYIERLRNGSAQADFTYSFDEAVQVANKWAGETR